MTNEELLERIANGDEAALAKLCLMNTGLVKDRARLIARQYHCLRQTKYGGLSDYTKETLSELESVGKLALVECVRAGGYDAEKGRFTTYVTPFLDGAMRRHLECSMGTLALDRDSMGLVRKAQRLYYQEGKEPSEICASLGIPFRAVVRAITYPTHFLMTSPGGSINLNRHAPSHAFTPDADIRAAAAHLDGGGVVSAFGQQDHWVLPAGTQEDGGLSLLNVESAGECYRVPGFPVQRSAAKEQLRSGKVLVVGLISAGVVILAPDPLPLQGAVRRQRPRASGIHQGIIGIQNGVLDGIICCASGGLHRIVREICQGTGDPVSSLRQSIEYRIRPVRQ